MYNSNSLVVLTNSDPVTHLLSNRGYTINDLCFRESSELHWISVVKAYTGLECDHVFSS